MGHNESLSDCKRTKKHGAMIIAMKLMSLIRNEDEFHITNFFEVRQKGRGRDIELCQKLLFFFRNNSSL